MGKSMKQMNAEAKHARTAPTFAEFDAAAHCAEFDSVNAYIPAEPDERQMSAQERALRREVDYLENELYGGFGDYLEKRAERGDESSARMLSTMIAELHALESRLAVYSGGNSSEVY